MGRITVTAFVTLDGVMQAPGAANEDTSGGFRHGGWVMPHFDEETDAFIVDVFSKVDAFLLGRSTYQIFATHWPRVTDPNDVVASKLNKLPKYVVSNTLRSADWNNSTVIGGTDVVAQLRTVREKIAGELQVHGSAGLLQTLLANDLVDELRLLTFPSVVGKGKRLFGEGTVPRTFGSVVSKVTPSGVVISTYRAIGALKVADVPGPA